MSTTREVAERVVLDTFNNDPSWTNAELINAVKKALQAERARVWSEAVQRLRDKAEEWRQQADRWQHNAQSAGMDIIREQDYLDRDVCLSKMSAAMTLAIEFDEAIAATKEGKPQE
jgi:hypothetical protein